jgi:hypothetical protein
MKNVMSWACSTYGEGERRGVYRVLVGKCEGKEPLGKPRCKWESNNINYIQEERWEGMDWIDMAQERDRWGSFKCGNKLSSSIKCWEFLVGKNLSASQAGRCSI